MSVAATADGVFVLCALYLGEHEHEREEHEHPHGLHAVHVFNVL